MYIDLPLLVSYSTEMVSPTFFLIIKLLPCLIGLKYISYFLNN